MGHAGALVCYPNGLKEGGYDLRSDGLAIGDKVKIFPFIIF